MLTISETSERLKQAYLPVVPCGLNADCNMAAWHLGPSEFAWHTKGDLYILDTEDCRYAIIRLVADDSLLEDGDDWQWLAENLTIDEVITKAQQIVKSFHLTTP